MQFLWYKLLPHMDIPSSPVVVVPEIVRNYSRKFSNEIAVLNGEDVAVSTLPSLHFFTAPKCASSYVNTNIMLPLAKSMGLTTIQISALVNVISIDCEYSYVLPEYQQIKDCDNKQRVLQYPWTSRGYFFGPHRNYHDGASLQDSKIILHLRDIRDAMTSHYYSMKYSHPLSKHNDFSRQMILNARKRANKLTIDEYVLQLIPRYKRTYEKYATHVLGKPNVCFVKYEQLVTDKRAWLQHIVSYLQLPILDSDADAILEDTDFSVLEESVHSHKRQVTPGDHLRKLKPETIEKLNEELGDTLRKFNYSVPA